MFVSGVLLLVFVCKCVRWLCLVCARFSLMRGDVVLVLCVWFSFLCVIVFCFAGGVVAFLWYCYVFELFLGRVRCLLMRVLCFFVSVPMFCLVCLLGGVRMCVFMLFVVCLVCVFCLLLCLFAVVVVVCCV